MNAQPHSVAQPLRAPTGKLLGTVSGPEAQGCWEGWPRLKSE